MIRHFILVLFFWVCWLSQCEAETQEDVYSNFPITKFQQSGEFVWCGESHLAISKHDKGADAGIRLLDVRSGQISKLTDNKRHRVVACRERLIFFVENGQDGALNVVDVATGQQRVIYSQNVFEHNKIADSPVSPDGLHLLAPTEATNIPLSNFAKILRIPEKFLKKNIADVAWSSEGIAYVLFNVDIDRKQRLLVLGASATVLNLPVSRGAPFIRLAVMRNTLYLLGANASTLYQIALKEPKTPLQRIEENVDEFTVTQNGRLIFLQDVGVDYSGYDHAKVKKSAYRVLFFKDEQGKSVELLRVPYTTIGLSNVQISPSGSSIAIQISYLDGEHNKSREIGVLHNSKF